MSKIKYIGGRLQDPKEDQALMRVGKIAFEPVEPEEEGENKALNELESELRKHNLPEEDRTRLRRDVQRLKYGQKLIVAEFTSTKTKTNGEQVSKKYYPIYAEIGVMFVPADRETGEPVKKTYDLQGNINLDGKELNVYAYSQDDQTWSTGNMTLAFHTKDEMSGVPKERVAETTPFDKLPEKVKDFKNKVDDVLIDKANHEDVPF